MNFPDEGVPVVLGSRPGRGRGRLSSDHRQQIYIESNGYLYPASSLGHPLQRSASSSGHGRRSPTQIFIDNSKSPACRRGRSAHFSDDSDECSPVRENRRHISRGRHHKHESRAPSPSPEIQAQLKKLHDMEEKEKEAEQRRRYAEEQALKKAADEEKKRKEEQMKEAAIKEYNTKQLEKAAKEKKAKEDADKEFRERVKTTFGKAGYSDETIERILENKDSGNGHEGQKKIMDLKRPTYIKVHRKHLSPDTLDEYDLPWEVDDVRLSLSFFVPLVALPCLPSPVFIFPAS